MPKLRSHSRRARTEQPPSTMEVKVAIKKKNRREHVKAKPADRTVENGGHGHDTVSRIATESHVDTVSLVNAVSTRSSDSIGSIREVARVLGDLLPVEDIISEEGCSEGHEGTLHSSDDLEELPHISWNTLKPEDYSVAHLAQELVQSRKDLYEYMRIIRKNLKILVNKAYILEDELFRKILQLILPMQKSPEWGAQANDPAIIVQEAIAALLESREQKDFALMAALKV